MIPVLETERLRLRGHTMDDFEASAAMWADPDIGRYISGRGSTREESWGRFLRFPGHWCIVGFGYWLIEEKATKRFLGEGGFGAFKRDMEPALDAPEQGWVLTREAQGKGYALEAVQAMLEWAEAHFKRTNFVCMISPFNTPSLKLAAKVGYREYDRATYKDEASVLLRRP